MPRLRAAIADSGVGTTADDRHRARQAKPATVSVVPELSSGDGSGPDHRHLRRGRLRVPVRRVHPAGERRRPERRPDVRARHHRQADAGRAHRRGKSIAGTGTIDADGTVGPIGGIRQKTVRRPQRGGEMVPRAGAAIATRSSGTSRTDCTVFAVQRPRRLLDAAVRRSEPAAGHVPLIHAAPA